MKDKKKLLIYTKKHSKETNVVSVRLPVDMIEQIDAVCEKTNRTRNDFLLKALDFALENLVIDEEDGEEDS
jgi:predicted DNA-binding protein